MMADAGSSQPQMRPARVDAIRDALQQTVRDEPEVAARRTRRRILGWGSLGLAIVTGAVTAGAVILGQQPVSNDELVYCLSSATQNADGTYPGSQATIADPSGRGRVSDAVDLCTQMWEQGVLGEGFKPDGSSNPPGTVPARLQVCVMRDGSAAVVPGESPGICQAIGLAPLEE
jgi:hypothetical protein